MRNTFILYRSYAEVLEALTDEEAGRLYKAIAKYALDGVETPLEGYLAGYFQLIKPQLDANQKKYENGAKGGRPKKSQTETEEKPNRNQTETKKEPNENQTETKTEPTQNPMINDKCIMINDKYIKENIKEKRKRFKPPTREELEEFAKANNLIIDIDRFINYYTSNGWKVGRNPMKDWQATARNWSRRESKKEAAPNDDSIEQLLAIELQALKGGQPQ